MRMQTVLIKCPNKLYLNSFIVQNGFQFVTINIHGLIDWEEKNNAVRFFSWLLKKKCDIISFRETHGTVSDIKKWEQIWRFSLWNNGEWPLRGVAILFNIHQGVVIKEDTKDNDRRVLFCEI
jgi:exonuclease III